MDNINDINQEQLDELHDIYHDLIYLYKTTKKDYFSQLKGMTHIEIGILEIVDRTPNIILREIIKILQVPNSTLTNAVNRLEKKNLIKRVINNDDKRSYGLALTKEGIEAQKEHKDGEREMFIDILASLEKEERGIFLKCLKKVNDCLTK